MELLVLSTNREEVNASLLISISAVLLLGIFVAVLCKWAGLRVWHALVCLLFGFYLAFSSLAPTIAQAAKALAGLLTGH